MGVRLQRIGHQLVAQLPFVQQVALAELRPAVVEQVPGDAFVRAAGGGVAQHERAGEGGFAERLVHTVGVPEVRGGVRGQPGAFAVGVEPAERAAGDPVGGGGDGRRHVGCLLIRRSSLEWW